MSGRFCLDCKKRNTCKTICEGLKKYLAHKYRAKNSPKAELWGDMEACEDYHLRRNNGIKERW